MLTLIIQIMRIDTSTLFRPFLFLLILSITGVFYSCNSPKGESSQTIAYSDSVQKEATVLAKRIFFLLHALAHTNPVKKVLINDSALTHWQQQERKAFQKAITDCPDMDCIVQSLEITDAENEEIITQLGNAYHNNKETFKKFIDNKIRPSHAFILSNAASDSALLIAAWQQQKKGINYILHGYLQNKGLRYASIDSAKYNVHDPAYLDTVKKTVQAIVEGRKGQALFFQPLLDISIKVLQLNDRNEAARFIPLTAVNKNAYSGISQIKWDDYPFSAILVFGSGPSKPGIAISKTGKARCRMGAALYNQNKAPFLVVSGGNVHPFQTKYNEAFEMKKFLMDSLHVPAQVIIMEPHARHTTGNVRNTNRIILKQKIPADKPILGVSSKGHIDYIADERFISACKRDFDLVPFTRMKRLSDTTVSYYPDSSSLQVNTTAPLNP